MDKPIKTWLQEAWQKTHDETASPVAISSQNMDFPALKSCKVSEVTWYWMLREGRKARSIDLRTEIGLTTYWEYDVACFPGTKYSDKVKKEKDAILHLGEPVFLVKRYIPPGQTRKDYWPFDETIMFPLFLDESLEIREVKPIDRTFIPGLLVGLAEN